MKICGLQKTTLLDFRAEWPQLYLQEDVISGVHSAITAGFWVQTQKNMNARRIFWHSWKNANGVLEGVCITGGEPTLQPDLEEFIRKVRSLGLAVKLDTNGTCLEY